MPKKNGRGGGRSEAQDGAPLWMLLIMLLLLMLMRLAAAGFGWRPGVAAPLSKVPRLRQKFLFQRPGPCHRDPRAAKRAEVRVPPAAGYWRSPWDQKTDWNERVLFFCFVSSVFGTFEVRCVSGFILVCDGGDDADLILQIREDDGSLSVSLTWWCC